MVRDYWALYFLSLIGLIAFIVLFILGLVFMRKLFFIKFKRIEAIALLLICSCITLSLSVVSANNFVLCCKDYEYVSNDTYIEATATVIEFTASREDYDGNGITVYYKPKFYLKETGEQIVLYVQGVAIGNNIYHVRGVELGETYIIRFYPNTKICDVIKKVS